MIGLLLLVSLACSNPDDTYTTAPGNYADEPTQELLAEWMAWRDISRGELLRRLTSTESSVGHGFSYGHTSGLDLISVDSYCPAGFYLEGEKVVLIYVASDEDLAKLKPEELAALFPPEARLASREHSSYRHFVNASSGIAWSATSDEVGMVELFHPTTVEQYKARFYEEPAPFIK
ncbi:hypothetical protein L6R46_20260 [Myxococcota bacterium]|nr:hypothetical protein [Myxococcota bacterium]